MTLYNEQGRYLIGGKIDLATRAGNPIANDRRPETNPVSLKEAEKIIREAHKSAITRSLTSKYNCMGLIFASRRTWVDTDQLELILNDDDYTKLPSLNNVVEGDVVIYKDNGGQITHVGLVSDVKPNLTDGSRVITILSQWGRDGEYFHRIDDVNFRLGIPAEAWTDRK